MGVVITFGNQKGGVGKTVTTGMIAAVLSMNYRVLAVDMDMQANLTQMITMKPSDHYSGRSVLEAIREADATPYVVHAVLPGHHLSLLPATDDLAGFKVFDPKDYGLLAQAINKVKDQFDYVLIDTPPALGDHLISAQIASDYMVAMAMTHDFAFDALGRFLTNMEKMKQSKPSLKVLGVVISMFEKTARNKNTEQLIREHYKSLVFETTIQRRAKLNRPRLPDFKLLRKSDRLNFDQYFLLAKELINRVET